MCSSRTKRWSASFALRARNATCSRSNSTSFKRQLFAASSENNGEHQKDLFFNEAESLGAQAESSDRGG